MTFVNVLDVAVLAFGVVDTNDVPDWTEIFEAAIQTAADNGRRAGVFVPARTAAYDFHHPIDPNLDISIDLRDKHNLTLVGEGPRSVLSMVGPGEWRLIHIGDGASDVVVRDLCLDGSGTPKNDQAHLVRIGTSRDGTAASHGARRISVRDCTLRGAPADGVNIAPESSTLRRDEVSDIVISGCYFLGNRRSGVSNQRQAKRVSILHNRFEGTSDQDIDFEPTGDIPDTGPSGYLILGNTMVRQGLSVSVTLSGTTPDSTSRINTFAFNKMFGGRLGVRHATDLAIVGNHIEIGRRQPATVVRLSGVIERLHFADNTVVRPGTALPGTLMNLSAGPTDYAFPAGDDDVETSVDVASNTLERTGHGLQTGTGPLTASITAGGALPVGLDAGHEYWAIRVDKDHFQLAANPLNAEGLVAVNLTSIGAPTFHLIWRGFPRTVSITGNRFSTSVPSAQPLITVANASTVSFRDNDVASYGGGEEIPVALKFESNDKVRKRPLSGWDVVGNRFRGDAELPSDFDGPSSGSFGVGVRMAVGNDKVRDVRVADNTFSGCAIQVELEAVGTGAFLRTPVVTGNIGDGRSINLIGLQAFLVGGNLQRVEGDAGEDEGTAPAGARYCGFADPTFVAPLGSLYSQLDGADGSLLWINTDGVASWKAIA